jgi:hypothetical protein
MMKVKSEDEVQGCIKRANACEQSDFNSFIYFANNLCCGASWRFAEGSLVWTGAYVFASSCICHLRIAYDLRRVVRRVEILFAHHHATAQVD